MTATTTQIGSMPPTLTVDIEHEGISYSARVETNGAVDIYQDGEWAGRGHYVDGMIGDCPANLGAPDDDGETPDNDDVYEALDAAISDALDGSIDFVLDAPVMTTATEIQMDTIASRRIDDTARAMMRSGVRLTWEQSDEIGDAGAQWLRDRLGLRSETTEDGVVYAPASRGE